MRYKGGERKYGAGVMMSMIGRQTRRMVMRLAVEQWQVGVSRFVKTEDARKRAQRTGSGDMEYVKKVIKKHSNEKAVLGGNDPAHGANYERGSLSFHFHGRGWRVIELDMLG